MLPAYATQMRIIPENGLEPQSAADAINAAVLKWIGEYYDRQSKPRPEVRTVDQIRWEPTLELQERTVRLASGEFYRSVLWTHSDDHGNPFYWTTRCDIAFADGLLDFQLQLGHDTDDPSLEFMAPPPARPRLIPTLLEDPRWRCFSGEQQLTIQPLLLTGAEVESFCDRHVFGGSRALPLLIVTPDPARKNSYPVNVQLLADRLAGSARVVKVRDGLAARVLDQYLGASLAVGPFGVRVLAPGVQPGDSGNAHWSFLGDRIRTAFENDQGFADYLFAQLALRSVATFREAPAVRAFRQAAARSRDGLLEELRTLQRRLSEETAAYDEVLEETRKKDDLLEAENGRLAEQVRDLEDQVRSLQHQLAVAHDNIASLSAAQGRGPVEHAEVPLPSSPAQTVLQIVDAAAARHRHLRILDSARKAAAEVPPTFKFPQCVNEALAVLEDAAATRAATGRVPDGWHKFFGSHGWQYKLLSKTAKTRYGDDYRFPYDGTQVLFEEHFTIGRKNANFCLSIHFSTTLQGDKIVVAYVGRHLRNTRS